MALSAPVRRWLFLGLLPLASATALVAGLVPSVVTRGLADPLDWLIPSALAFALVVMAGGETMRGWPMRLAGAVVAVPPVIFVGWGAAAAPWAGLLAFSACLGGTAWAMARWRRWPVLLAGLAFTVAVRLVAFAAGSEIGTREGPPVAVSSALPLFAQGGGDPLAGVGKRAPIIDGLAAAVRPEPVDDLAAESLSRYSRLLLIQPRLLSPAELVALDGWVRQGGRVTILADPWLAWPEEGPLTRPGRAPLTSLLDPLLAHWGLVLDPARLEGDRVRRRILDDGAAMRTVAASRFSPSGDGTCLLAEEGLFADCRIGKGRALLVADADWVDAGQWTRNPAAPRDRRGWTSDAVPILARLVTGEPTVRPSRGWIASYDRQAAALRAALAAIALLWLLTVWQALRKPISHLFPSPADHSQGVERPPGPDSG